MTPLRYSSLRNSYNTVNSRYRTHNSRQQTFIKSSWRARKGEVRIVRECKVWYKFYNTSWYWMVLWRNSNVYGYSLFISPWTNWSPFCRWHFPTYFYKWKALYLMVWRRTGGKPLFEPMLTPLIDAYMRHQGNDRMNRISSIREFCKRRTKFSFDCHHNQWQANFHPMHRLSMVS